MIHDITKRLSASVGNAQGNGFTKRPHCSTQGAPTASLAARRAALALCPPTTSRTTQIMAAMEHDKRSKAAISIMEHRGREQGAEGVANTIAPAQLLSQHTLASARVRPSAAFCCAPKRSIEEIVKQTTAYAHDSSARQSAHAPCIHGRRGKLAASRQRPGRPTRRMEPKGRLARPPCRCSSGWRHQRAPETLTVLDYDTPPARARRAFGALFSRRHAPKCRPCRRLGPDG